MMFMKFYFFLLLVSFGVFVNGAAIHRRAASEITAAPEATGAVNPALFQASAQPTVISIQGGEAITLADVGVTTVFAGKTWTIVPPNPTGSPSASAAVSTSTDSGSSDSSASVEPTSTASGDSSSSSAEPTSTDGSSGDSSSAEPTSTGSSTSSSASAEPTSTDSSTSSSASAEPTSTDSSTSSSAEPTSTGDGESSTSAEPTSTASGESSSASAEPTGEGESSSASGSPSATTTSGTSEPTSTDSQGDGESSAQPTAVVTTVLTTDGATETIVSSPGPFITLAPTGTTTSFAGQLYTIVPASRLTTSVTSSTSTSSTAEPSSTESANGGIGKSNAAMSLHSFTFRGFMGIVGGAVIGAWLTL